MLPAPGDIRNVISALANVDSELMDLFQHRFQATNGLSRSFLRKYCLSCNEFITGNFYSAVKKVSNILNVQGKYLFQLSMNQLHYMPKWMMAQLFLVNRIYQLKTKK